MEGCCDDGGGGGGAGGGDRKSHVRARALGFEAAALSNTFLLHFKARWNDWNESVFSARKYR